MEMGIVFVDTYLKRRKAGVLRGPAAADALVGRRGPMILPCGGIVVHKVCSLECPC